VTDPLLRLDSIGRAFGSLRAVDDVSLTVATGARHALVGPNGAGKSTLFNLVAGTLRVGTGRILLGDRDITRLPEHRRAGLGVARTFQHSSVFLGGTVLENVLTGVLRKTGRAHGLFRPALRYRELVDRCDEALATVGLVRVRDRLAGELSHGERRQLELAMTLAMQPRLLLLDEPAAGISPRETARLAEILAALPGEMTVLLIEHDLDLVFDFADTVTVLQLGRELRTGTPAEVRADAEVRAAYLGTDELDDLFTGPVEESR
jgi:branched-chain amino acid transport system ATP-binding protein